MDVINAQLTENEFKLLGPPLFLGGFRCFHGMINSRCSRRHLIAWWFGYLTYVGFPHFQLTWHAFGSVGPFALEDGGKLAPMAPELVDRLAVLVAVRLFLGIGATNYRLSRYDNYIRMQYFVRGYTYVPFRRFLGDVRRKFMQRLSAALHDAFELLSSRCFAGGQC
jgi:hypothetical protein